MSCKKSHSHTLCPLPWMSLSLNSDHSFRLCCHDTKQDKITNHSEKVLTAENTQRPEDVLNSSSLKNIRSMMLNRQIPTNCESCFQLEESGINSPREDYLNQFHHLANYENTKEDGTVDENQKVYYLEAVTDNKCNLRCRMCHPQYSSLLEDDWKKLDLPLDKSYQNGPQQSLASTSTISSIIPSLKLLTITGGEPLLSRQSLELTGLAAQTSTNLSVRYYTNGTIFPSNEMLDFWSQMEQVTLYLSLDGVGKTQEYIRYPSRWEVIKKNTHNLFKLQREKSNISIKVHTVLQAYNIQNINELILYLYQYREQTPFVPSFTPVETPSLFRLNVLPHKTLKRAEEKIRQTWESLDFSNVPKEYLEESKTNYKSLLSAISRAIESHNPKDYFAFLVYTKKWDELRNQSYKDILNE